MKKQPVAKIVLKVAIKEKCLLCMRTRAWASMRMLLRQSCRLRVGAGSCHHG